MTARRLPDGRLEVPARAETEDGLIGDGMQTISPDHPDYAAWDHWLTSQESPSPDPEV